MAAVGSRWGYHRLRDPWARRVVAAAAVRSGEVVVDIGAGAGALTFPLLDGGARVIAVELHRGRADLLRAAVAGRDCSVLTTDVRAFTFPGRPARVVANPPFALAASVIAAVTAAPYVWAADLVLPLWLVERHVRTPRRWAGFAASRGLLLPRFAFRPAASVPCAVLQLRRPRRR